VVGCKARAGFHCRCDRGCSEGCHGWIVLNLMPKLMLSQEDDAQAKPQRVALSHDEYPGTAPSGSEVRKAEEFRLAGNVAYSEGKFDEAVHLYSSAALLNPCDHLVYSNRSACWLRIGRPIEALDDAELCVQLFASFAKGYLRKGTAEQLLNRKVDAQASFRQGLTLDPESSALKSSLRDIRMDSSSGLHTTLHHVLFVSPQLQMDNLFEVLEDPDRLTLTYVEENSAALDAQFECLTQTLRIDVGLLLASPVLRDAYDRVTFACGQLLQWAPEAVTRHMTTARHIVEGLGLSVRCGWSIHHGVAKFSANALTILATSDGACDNLRREAVRLLLGGMLRWLIDLSSKPENPPEDRDVCGCTFLSPRLSAATWLERLFEHGTKTWVHEECEQFVDIVTLTIHLCLTVRDERAAPLGLACLLCLPKVAKMVMDAEAVIDLSTCSRDPTGRRDSRRWLTQEKGRGNATGTGGGTNAGTAHVPAAPMSTAVPSALAPVGTPCSGGGGAGIGAGSRDAKEEGVSGASLSAAPVAFAEVCNGCGSKLIADAIFCYHCGFKYPVQTAEAMGATAGGNVDGKAEVPAPMLKSAAGEPATGQLAVQRLHAPSQRLGEWMMASLGYLIVFVDDDALFAARACSALQSLMVAVPDGVTRFADGVWVGLPLLERLSSLACHHTTALELLETLARHSRSARVAMCSLAGALAAVQVEDALPELHEKEVAIAAAAVTDLESPPLVVSPVVASVDWGVYGNEDMRSDGSAGTISPELLDDSGEPSWAECYHELRDELWVGDLPPRSTLEEQLYHSPSSLVVLGNFEEVATQVPVASCLALLVSGSGSGVMADGGHTADMPLLQVSAVLAVWNPRFADAVHARLAIDGGAGELGGGEWVTGMRGGIVLLTRSIIQQTPVTPDWATAVWLCADAGAQAVVVVNDLIDDGPAQPAFRMGLFGSPAPPIPAFMICGRDGEAILTVVSQRDGAPEPLRMAVQTIRPSPRPGAPAAPSCPEAGAVAAEVPPWPLLLRMPQDVAQAWSLVETVHRIDPTPGLAEHLECLAERMGLPEKRVWLTRRLQRYHRGDTAEEQVEPQLAFVECDRSGEQLQQLRRQLANRTGIGAPDITGEYEVRFRDESSVGSAVMREWMDLVARKAFLPAGHHLLTSYDNGARFLPDPVAQFINRHWQGDFELLGRLIGLAIWHQVTLDLPLHPYVCKLLLHDEDLPCEDIDDSTQLMEIDAELYRNKVLWLLTNNVSALGYDMPFTDVFCCGVVDTEVEEDTLLSALPEVVGLEDALPGDEQAVGPLQLRRASRSSVELVPGGGGRVVTEQTKGEFVAALVEWRLRTSLRGPIAAMRRGLTIVVPPVVFAEARQMLSSAELCALLAGSRDIDVDDWERNTRTVGGLTPSSREVRMFWGAVRQWALEGHQARLQDLLQFATGSRRVPVGGFAQLVGFNGGKHMFTLAKGVQLSACALPTSHACICTVDLPPWPSVQVAAQKLLTATEAGHQRFDEGTGRLNV